MSVAIDHIDNECKWKSPSFFVLDFALRRDKELSTESHSFSIVCTVSAGDYEVESTIRISYISFICHVFERGTI